MMNHDDLIKQVYLALRDLRLARESVDRAERLLNEMWAGYQDSAMMALVESINAKPDFARGLREPTTPKKRRGRPPKVNGAVGKGAH